MVRPSVTEPSLVATSSEFYLGADEQHDAGQDRSQDAWVGAVWRAEPDGPRWP